VSFLISNVQYTFSKITVGSAAASLFVSTKIMRVLRARVPQHC
jgi:hypothetical protein